MRDKKTSRVAISTGIARLILRDRNQRRKIMSQLLMLALGLMAAGLWLINGWLEQNPWRFLLWWGACGSLTCLAMLFAIYDILAVMREEREK